MRTSIHAYFAAANEGGGAAKDNTNAEQVETSGGGSSGSLNLEPGATPEAEHEGHIEVGGGNVIPPATPAAEGEPENKAEGEPDKPEGEGDEQEQEAVPRIEGDFKADDPETVAKFDKAFKSDTGTLNMNALSQQWWANYAASGDAKQGHLDDNAYAYLESQFGLDRATVQNFEQAQVALNEKNEGGLHEVAGGADAFAAMVEWGRAGGYSEAQRKSFNDAIAAGGQRAQEAVELLSSRYQAANKDNPIPAATTTSRVTGELPPKGGAPDHSQGVFHSREEWLEARQKAGNNMDEQQMVSMKYRRSPGASGW